VIDERAHEVLREEIRNLIRGNVASSCQSLGENLEAPVFPFG
jgi:hypothetical protein